MKNTITTTSQASANFLRAGEQIMLFMDELGFTSDTYNDPEMIKHTIAQIIRESIEGNVNYTYDVEFSPKVCINSEQTENCSCCCDEDEDLNDVIEEIWGENEEQNQCDCGFCRCQGNEPQHRPQPLE